MSRRDGACWRHPAQRAAGVCADCLKERLSALSPSAEALVPRRASYSDRSSAFGFVAPVDRRNLCSGACNRLGNGDYGVARGGAAQHQQQLVSPLLAEAYLRRSKSWSHWEGSSGVVGGSWNNAARSNNLQMGNGFAGRKSDAVLDDWTRQRFFSIFAKDLSQQKRKESSACPSNNRSTPQHFHGAGNDRGWLSSKVDGRRESLNAASSSSGSAAGLENRSSSSAKKSSRKSSPSSAWWTSMLAAFRKSKPKASAEAEDRKKSSNANSSSSLASYFNRARKEEARLMNSAKCREFSNWRQHPAPPPRPADSNQHWISSPLRIFKHSSMKTKTGGNCSNLSDAQDQQNQHHHRHYQQSHQQSGGQRQSSSEDRSPWSIPSSTELKKLQAATPAYTAYYRDYGAWSLSSSPVPNNRWSNSNNCGRGKQPWENRDVSHTASSPYHRFGGSTWNFYLTPLRPAARAKATATRY